MGFYGNISSVNKSTFQFDKIYSNRAEMEDNCKNDGVFIGRYVLVNYDQELSAASILATLRNEGTLGEETLGLVGYQIKIKSTNEETQEDFKTVVLNKNEFSRCIKQVIFAVSMQETQAVLTGVCFNIEKNILEMASTDGNRLTRVKKELDEEYSENINFIVPSKTLSEVQRISSIVEDENITLKIYKNKIIFEFTNLTFQSRLIEGVYPKYQQLIPENNDKKIIVDRAELINAIERVAIMVNDRTNVVKFNFITNQLEIMADTPEAGKSKDYIDIEYSYDDMLTAFNYKYVLDGLKNMDSKNIEIEISDVLAASIFKPQDDEGNYICLIMPVKVQ